MGRRISTNPLWLLCCCSCLGPLSIIKGAIGVGKCHLLFQRDRLQSLILIRRLMPVCYRSGIGCCAVGTSLYWIVLLDSAYVHVSRLPRLLNCSDVGGGGGGGGGCDCDAVAPLAIWSILTTSTWGWRLKIISLLVGVWIPIALFLPAVIVYSLGIGLYYGLFGVVQYTFVCRCIFCIE